MKSMRYLNFILTVIAVLIFLHLVVQLGSSQLAYAGPQTSKVDVNLDRIGGYSIFGGKLKVTIEDEVEMKCK